MPGKTFPSLALAVERSKENVQLSGTYNYIFIPGPINSAVCYVTSAVSTTQLGPDSCFGRLGCFKSLAFWILVPPVKNWTVTGNATLIKYGNLEISYGLVNDMRNGTTRPIASLMFSLMGSSEKCLWVSMIYGSMLTEAWSHIALTVDASNTLLNVYFNGKESIIKKQSCSLKAAVPSQNTYVSSNIAFTCFDELADWTKILTAVEVERIYNATIFGGICSFLFPFICGVVRFDYALTLTASE